MTKLDAQKALSVITKAGMDARIRYDMNPSKEHETQLLLARRLYIAAKKEEKKW